MKNLLLPNLLVNIGKIIICLHTIIFHNSVKSCSCSRFYSST